MKNQLKRSLALALTIIMVIGLMLSSASAATHTVAPGENLSSLAQKYLGDRTKWREIYKLNKDIIKNPNVIYVGQVLTVPGAEEPIVSATEATEHALAKVETGWYIGTKEDGVYTFKGMQYGVAERFKSAQKPEPFAGLHSAMNYGNSCPSSNQSRESATVNGAAYMTPNANYVEHEDCLYLNVWSTAMNPTAEMPVLFFIHGGGFTSGSSNELTYYDGANFAKSQDVVFVSVNSRLNVLGYTDLSAYGEEYANSGNLGQEDLVLALEWVRDNIAQFGGDPDNVTIMGQSGGGGKVAALLTCAPAEGLFHKAAQFSGGGSITRTSEQSQAAGVALVEKAKTTYGLATDEEALAKLAALNYEDLCVLATGTGVGNGPTIDGKFVVDTPIDADGNWHEMASKIPMWISTVYAESAGSIGPATYPAYINNATPFMPNPEETFIGTVNKDYMTEEFKEDQLTQKYGDMKDAIIAAFAKAYPELEPYDVTRINVRNNDKVTGRANSCTAPTYQAVFAYELPLFGGTMAWHTGGDLPFVFNNLEYIANMVAGDEANAQRVADASSTALGNFCKYGDPSTSELAWAAFTVENGETMIFTTNSEVRNYHDAELMELLGKLE